MEPNIDKYASGWSQRAESERAACIEREKTARERLSALAQHLASRHGASRVSLIGSLARATFRRDSDVDLLVWGLPENAAVRAAREASDLMGIPVDLLRAEDLRDDWLSYHERHGRVLHER